MMMLATMKIGGLFYERQNQRRGRSTGFSYQIVSNPYCSTSDTTMGWTVTESDTMGRTVNVGHYSGASLPSPGSPGTCTGAVCSTYGATSSGSFTTVTDETGLVSRTMTSDGLGRLKQVLDGTGVTTFYGYGLNNLTLVTQSGQSRAFTYSSLNRLTAAANPENGTITYRYDSDGNLVKRVDNRGTILCFGVLTGATCNSASFAGYNSLNQPLLKQYSDGTPSVNYAYGQTSACGTFSVGRLCSVTNGVSAISYTYTDAAGKVTGSTQNTAGTSYPFTYTYNLNDGLTLEEYPSTRVVSYGYDAAGRVNLVENGPLLSPIKTYATGVAYAPHHALSGLTMGNGVSETWTFNSRLQPTRILAAGSLSSLTLTYSHCSTAGQDTAGCSPNNGNVLSAGIASPGVTSYTQVFGYDAVNRLSTATENTTGNCSTWCQTYSYDVYGNRAVPSTTGPYTSGLTQTSTAGFNSSNRNQTAGWVYDGAGNVIADPGGSSYVYDAENRQIAYCAGSSTCSVGSPTMAYSYDGDGKRVQTVGGVTTIFVYDAGGQLAAEYPSTQPQPTCSVTCYVTVDSLGSTRMVTDQGGNCVLREDYLPFGQTIASSGGNRGTCYSGQTIRQQFTSKERDAETGNDFFEARYYSGAQGRFTSPDPLMATPQRILDPQQWNMYAYVRNNPLRLTDPTGLDIWLQGCGEEAAACHDNYVGTWDANNVFSRTHLTGDQTANATIGENGITVTQDGKAYQGVWDRNANEQGAVLVSGAGDLNSFNANLTGACQDTCIVSGVLQNKNGTPATAGDLRNALQGKSDWFANNNDPFHRHDGTNDTSFNANPPGPAGQRSTDVTVPQRGNSLDSRFHVNAGYPFQDVYQMTVHVISIMRTFTNAVGITHPTTGQ